MKFNKPAKSFDGQCQLLIDRGMHIPGQTKAIHYLAHINYYRLEAYWLPYEISCDPHQFSNGTDFDAVLNHYLFDRQLTG